MSRYYCHFDGATNPNPGPIGLGVVVFDENGKEVLSASGSGGIGSNNEGEYKALIWAMELLLERGIENVIFKGDSKLVVEQVLGNWNVNAQGLFSYHAKAQELGQKFAYCNLEWVPRSLNERADALSKNGANKAEPTIIDESNKKHRETVKAAPREDDKNPCNDLQPESEGKHRKVKVRGLKGNKIAFIYSNEVVVLDVGLMRCSCAHFAGTGNCEHVNVIKKHQAG